VRVNSTFLLSPSFSSRDGNFAHDRPPGTHGCLILDWLRNVLSVGCQQPNKP